MSFRRGAARKMNLTKEFEMSEDLQQEQTAVFTTNVPKSADAARGSNLTPRSAMRTHRGSCDHHKWLKQFDSYAKKLDREAYARKSETK